MTSMLPALPKTFGRLSDVFISALGSISGSQNRLSLPKVHSAAVIMVDGLGSTNLKNAGGHAPFLNQILAGSKSISTGFPTTTAANLTSFATGRMPGEHGILGYSVFDRDRAATVNMLNGWGLEVNPREWRQGETVSGLAQEANVRCVFVGPSEYAGSGFTEVIMERADYVAARTISERLEVTLKLLSEREPSLVYCYIPELDQAAHAYGVGSENWLQKTEVLNASMLQFSSGMPSHSGAILTADHGIVDVPASNHIFLDELINVDLLSVTGDPRCQFMYLSDPAQSSHLVESLNQQLAGRAIAVPKSSILEQGLYGERVSEGVGARMPDLFVIAIKNCALYHRNFASSKSMNMVGQHGGLSDVELMVPLLKFGAYA